MGIDCNEKGKTEKKSRKFARLIFFVVLVFFSTMASAIAIDRYLFPYLRTVSWIEKTELFKMATEDVVVVNKTEQITVAEDLTIANYTNRSAASVAEIISKQKQEDSGVRGSFPSNPVSKIGSGLVVTADGLILTYSDAIMLGNATYRIYTSSSHSGYDARLIAVDSFSNLALLKIDDVSDLPTTSFIDPADMKIGLKTVAIGRNGNNFQAVYKSGLISEYAEDFSLAGPLASSEKLQGVYFAEYDLNEIGDESMNGAIITNYNGDVLGILGSTKDSQRRQYFIIPVEHVENFINQYISSGLAKRGSLGAYYLSLSQETAYIHGLSEEKGALIFSASNQQGLAVISGSAADKAGLKIGDIIKNVNGEEVGPEKNLAGLISKYKPGDRIELKVLRGGNEILISAILD